MSPNDGAHGLMSVISNQDRGKSPSPICYGYMYPWIPPLFTQKMRGAAMLLFPVRWMSYRYVPRMLKNYQLESNEEYCILCEARLASCLAGSDTTYIVTIQDHELGLVRKNRSLWSLPGYIVLFQTYRQMSRACICDDR